MTTSRVSIVIPTYNQRPSYLASALESALTQTIPCEVILVDDGSTEPVSAEWSGLKVIRHRENRGIAAALNTGIREMTGEWFCWLPSDDLFAPDKVERQLAAIGDRRASYHRYYWTTREDGVPERISEEYRGMDRWKRQRQMIASGCFINGLTVMIHRSVFDDVGAFDETYELAQDWEMWCRISQKHEWGYVPTALATRRVAGNLSSRVERDPALKAKMADENARIQRIYEWRM